MQKDTIIVIVTVISTVFCGTIGWVLVKFIIAALTTVTQEPTYMLCKNSPSENLISLSDSGRYEIGEELVMLLRLNSDKSITYLSWAMIPQSYGNASLVDTVQRFTPGSKLLLYRVLPPPTNYYRFLGLETFDGEKLPRYAYDVDIYQEKKGYHYSNRFECKVNYMEEPRILWMANDILAK